MTNNWLPKNSPRISSYLIVEDLSILKQFTAEVFSAECQLEIKDEKGKLNHVEFRIDDSVIMAGHSSPEFPALTAMLHIYVPNCDEIYQIAIDAGAETIMPPSDQFYGDRSAGVKGPDGNFWWIATHIEDLSHEEIEKRDRCVRETVQHSGSTGCDDREARNDAYRRTGTTDQQ